jgi:tmRNA-binding protein
MKIIWKGLTIVRGYYNNYWFYQVNNGLGKGKHTYDKSKAIKLRDLDRDLQKNI